MTTGSTLSYFSYQCYFDERHGMLSMSAIFIISSVIETEIKSASLEPLKKEKSLQITVCGGSHKDDFKHVRHLRN